jgi:hypothetical protein
MYPLSKKLSYSVFLLHIFLICTKPDLAPHLPHLNQTGSARSSSIPIRAESRATSAFTSAIVKTEEKGAFVWRGEVVGWDPARQGARSRTCRLNFTKGSFTVTVDHCHVDLWLICNDPTSSVITAEESVPSTPWVTSRCTKRTGRQGNSRTLTRSTGAVASNPTVDCCIGCIWPLSRC